MARKKKMSIEFRAGTRHFGWPRSTWPWIPAAATDQTLLYVYPSSSYDHNFEDRLPRYHHDRNAVPVKGMAKVVPWLLSMCLLEYATYPGSNALAPNHHQVARSPVIPGFPSSLRNYKSLISSHEPLPGHVNCPNFLGPENKIIPATTPEYGNQLYGSTPDSNERFLGSSFQRNHRPSGGRALDIFDPRSVNQLESYEDDYVGPAMELVFAWTIVDFEYDSIEARDAAIYNGDFIPENTLPLGLDVWRDRVFLTLPKWKDGIPATLATVPRHSKTNSPKLRPYPSWEWHQPGNCQGLTSVFRIQVDECDRLWVLDSGKVNITKESKQLCPPAIFVFDLTTDTLIKRYAIPDDQVKQDSLYTNIVVDIRNEECATPIAYASDVLRYGLLVYDFYKDSSFRVEHHLFYPDPLASKYDLHGIKFQWTDGIFGMALSPVDIHDDRTLFFHPMSSFREFAVSTSVLRDKRTVERNTDNFMPIGRPRAKDYGHSSGSAIDKNGVMFFNMVTRDSVWCWDTRKEYIPQNLGVIGTSNLSLVFPNDVRVDHEIEQSVWVLSNRLAMYLYGSIDSSKNNYRVFKANVNDAVKDTVCDPGYVQAPGSEQGYDDTC